MYVLQVPPVFSVRPQDKVVRLGEAAVLQCRVSPAPHQQQLTRVFWQQQDLGPLAPGPGHHSQLSVDPRSGSLRLAAVTPELAGWFGCFAVSATGSSSAVARGSLKSSLLQPPPIIQLGET